MVREIAGLANRCQAGLGPASITEPFDADGRKMNSTWLVVTTVAGVIYFVPLVRLLAPFAH